ncbi:MAG: hypothetical protein ACFE96_15035 [Candidatus Hermodarchaeota archaeon]
MEKKAWKTYFDDGLFDIYFGILIASFGPSIAFYDILPIPLNVLLGPFLIGFGLAFFILSKKYVIKPRIGFVKYGRKRKVRKWKTMVVISVNIMLLLIILLFNLSISGGGINLPYNLVVLLEGFLFLTVPLCFVAYFLQLTRLYFYALLFGCGFFLADISSLVISIPFNFLFIYLMFGVIIITVGIIFFIRFIRTYQLAKRE